MTEIVQHITKQLESIYGGRRWVLATDVLAGTAGVVRWLERLGAEKALVIASARGAGDPPDPEFAPNPIVFDVTGDDMMGSIQTSAEMLANLPADARALVDAFDPTARARVIGTIYDDGRPVADRTKFGARPESWQRLEDKTTVDALWDVLGVERAPSVIVPANDLDALRAASAEVDLGDGTVWAADARDGFHGGASYTRRVRSEADMRDVQAHFSPRADSIRVMGFLEGIPCSIHGFVFDNYVAVLRPCEMIVFRKPDGSFHYGRAASFWDPPTLERVRMRETARRAGAHLRDSVGYRGAFTIDGILTTRGFRPTELNPRFGAALGTLTSSIDLPMTLLNYAMVEGGPVDWRPRELEALLLEAADDNRAGGTMAVVKTPIDATERHEIVFENGEFRAANEGEAPSARVMLGPHSVGGIVFITFVPEQMPVGRSVGGRAAAALRWADREWSLGIGELEAAAEVSPASSPPDGTPASM